MSRILFASSEAHPLVKTGGLGDVAGALPPALAALGAEVRLVVPAYRTALSRAGDLRRVATLHLPEVATPVHILEGRLPGSGVPLWLVDSPLHFDRDGAPYTGLDGHDWPDNPARFAAFSRAVVELAQDRAGLNWRADVVHCNDWQTGLAPALLSLEPKRPGTVFTIHNLAYQGQFGADQMEALGLPGELWSMDGLEFWGNLSFIKGGLAYADWITTVSPTYAKEIRHPAFGYGLEGLLNHRAERLRGILNGVDYRIWDPAGDTLISKPYTADSLADKCENKLALQARFGLPAAAKVPLLGLVGRIVEQKGLDLVLEILPRLLQRELQVVLLGTGDRHLEEALREVAARHPQRMAVNLGYDEALAHLVEAGADMFVMPSRFEPCGLNQIYSLRYGTPPIVRRTGGLADTVVDCDETGLAEGRATGFVFDEASGDALGGAIERAVALYGDPAAWKRLMQTAMAQDFSWEQSARRYLELYAEAAARQSH